MQNQNEKNSSVNTDVFWAENIGKSSKKYWISFPFKGKSIYQFFNFDVSQFKTNISHFNFPTKIDFHHFHCNSGLCLVAWSSLPDYTISVLQYGIRSGRRKVKSLEVVHESNFLPTCCPSENMAKIGKIPHKNRKLQAQ